MKTRFWMVRPRPSGVDRTEEFKANNFIAIGWPALGDLSGKSKDELKTLLADKEGEYGLTDRKLGIDSNTLDRFVNVMAVNDIIVVPNGNEIIIGKISSGYFYKSELDTAEEGYPHQRTVHWLNIVTRDSLSLKLRNSLKSQGTIASLTKHAEEISTLISGTTYQESDVVVIEESMLTSNITPKEFKTASLSDFSVENNKKLFESIESFLKKSQDEELPETGFYIHGDIGIGKTRLLYALKENIGKQHQNIKVHFINLPQFFSEIKYYIANDNLQDYINSIKTVDLLILDDIGMGSYSNFLIYDILYPVLEYRAQAKHLTFFSSNLNLDELKAFLESSFLRTSDDITKLHAEKIINRIERLATPYPMQK